MAMERRRQFGSTLDRWEPFRGLSQIQTEMDRLFAHFFFVGRPAAGPGVRDRVWAPAMDMYETKDDLFVKVELPGLREKDVQVSITSDVLTVKGERTKQQESKDDGYQRLERWFGKFERRIELPVAVQADRAKATYREGVLEIKLPKAEAVKPKEIRIDVA